MGQLRNKCVLDVPATANWSLWTNNERNWFLKEGVPELCGNASGARLILKREFQNYVGMLVELGKY